MTNLPIQPPESPGINPSDVPRVLAALIDGLTLQRANIDALADASMLFRADLSELKAMVADLTETSRHQAQSIARITETAHHQAQSIARIDQRLDRVSATTELQAAVATQQAQSVAELVSTVRLLLGRNPPEQQ